MTVRAMGSVEGAKPTGGSAAGKQRVICNDITKNLQLMSDRKLNVDHDPKTMK